MKPTLRVHTNENRKQLGDMFGIFFEDINYAADGGLYGELIQNRSFEFDPVDHQDFHALTAWEVVQWTGSRCAVHVERSNPLNEKRPSRRNNWQYNAALKLGSAGRTTITTLHGGLAVGKIKIRSFGLL